MSRTLKPNHYHHHPDGSHSLCDCTPDDALAIYDSLRRMHQILKEEVMAADVTYSEEQRNAIDAVHSVLYLAEAEFIRQDNQVPNICRRSNRTMCTREALSGSETISQK